MADSATCDLCGAGLLGRPVRYRLKLEVAQAYDVMEIAAADLARDQREELKALADELARVSDEEARRMEEEVFAAFTFDLCRECARNVREDARRSLRAALDRFRAGPYGDGARETGPA